MFCWMRKRLRSLRKMDSFTLTEEEPQKPEELASANEIAENVENEIVEEMRKLMDEFKLKRKNDKDECKQWLEQASRVKSSEGETLYQDLFGLIVHECVDTILKREVQYITVEMCCFRRNLSEKIAQDEALMDMPMDLNRLPDAFDEAWRVWRECNDENCESRKESAYQVFVKMVSKEDDIKD